MIQTRALHYHYPKGPELFFADLQVPQGGTLLLRGNSGSGKSTWLALAAGLLTVGGGKLAVAGESLEEMSRGARDRWRARNIGFLPQRLHLSDAFTVEGNLALSYFAARLNPQRATVTRALETLGVGHLAKRKPTQLSGGQAQRVALARTILMEPKVILADEPTASLDDDNARTGLELLKNCALQCNATLVVATHDPRVQEAFPQALVYQIGLQPAWAVRGKL